MMKKSVVFAMAVLCACLLGGRAAWAEKDEDEKSEKHEMLAGGKVNGETLEHVKVSMAQGLSGAESQGKPLSAKFESGDGKLQLSVYTMKGNAFSEVIVDHKTGKIVKTEAITGGEDLAAAKAQSRALAKAKISLRAAAAKALKANKGFLAISAVPAMKGGHPMADVTLGQEEEVKTVSIQLD